MDKDTIWNIVLVISIIILINGMTKTGSIDKKEAQAGQDQATAGALGTVVSFIGKKTVWPLIAIVPTIIAGGLLLFPTILSSWVNTFRSLFGHQAVIPMWVWIAGFGVLALMAFSRKK